MYGSMENIQKTLGEVRIGEEILLLLFCREAAYLNQQFERVIPLNVLTSKEKEN
jgi:hypothetical protein